MAISKTLSTLSLAGALIAAAVALSPSEASAAGKKSHKAHSTKKHTNASQIGLGHGNGGGSQVGFGGGASQIGFGGGNGGGNIIRPCPACNSQG